MRKVAALVLVIAVLVTPACSRRRSTSDSTAVDHIGQATVAPQVIPVRNWLQAVKARDVDLFMTVFSRNILPRLDRDEWERVLRSYVFLWGEVIADFDVEDSAYTVLDDPNGDPDGARVVVHLGDQDLPSIRVINDQGLWYVDER